MKRSQSWPIGERRISTRLRIAAALVAAATVMGCLALAGCQSPTPSGDQKASEPAPKAQAVEPAAAEAKAEAPADAAANLPGTFTNVDAGAWGDTQYARAVNAGNRGCNSCHADLFSVLPKGMNSKGLHEVDKPAAYGRVYTYNDCTTCHVHSGGDGSAKGGCGPYMAPSIHGSHYANQTFLAQGGNCFSCHVEDATTGQLGMWDELKHTRVVGLGNNAPLEVVGTWISGRGYETSTVTGGTIEHDIELDNIVLNQNPTESADDLYGATNMDYPDVTDENFTVDIKGVVNEKTYTMDDLRAMPQTEFTYTRVCMTNGNNGGWYIANIPAKGVLISDIIEDCGGLANDANAFASIGYDGWQGAGTPNPNTAALSGMDPNAMIAIEQFGEPIELIDGGPAYFILPNTGATKATKWVKEISFSHVDDIQPASYVGMRATSWAGWITPNIDNQQVKLGETLNLSGFAFTLPFYGVDTTTDVVISADYGETWTSLGGVPESFDEDQWVRWSADWTPEAAGMYCLTVGCETENDETIVNMGHVIVKVVK